jgi:hypothetical protein
MRSSVVIAGPQHAGAKRFRAGQPGTRQNPVSEAKARLSEVAEEMAELMKQRRARDRAA